MAKYEGKKTRFSKATPDLGKHKVKMAGSKNKIPLNFGGFKKIFNGIHLPKVQNLGDIVHTIVLLFRFSVMSIKQYWKIMAGFVIFIGIIFTIVLVTDLVDDYEKVKKLGVFKPNTITKIYDKNGVLVSELFKQKREVVPFNKIPQNLKNAFISMEDNDFYDHFGVNIKGIIRAAFVNLFSVGIKQGGSTMTQQLAKILLTSRKRTIYRKVREAILAIIIEIKYEKDKIFSLYLNQIYLGHGAYGVESASKIYFNKHVWELNLAECALLSTLPPSPNRLSPIRHTKKSMNKHKIALSRMVDLEFITKEKANETFDSFWPKYVYYLSDIDPTANTWSRRVDNAPWFTEYIRRKLVKKYGENEVYYKGLNVYTTLDLKKQIAAQKELKRSLKNQTKISMSLDFNKDEEFEKYSETVEIFSELFELPKFARSGSKSAIKFNSKLRKKILNEFEILNFITGTDDIGKTLDEFKKKSGYDRKLQNVEGAIISINHRNGYIETMVGGSKFASTNQLNRVMQSRRQAGSAIKPLLYAAAIESGKFTAATAVLDSPIVYLDNDGGDWLPENYEGEYYGLLRLRRALIKSINVISIRLADTIGIDTVINYYSKFLRFSKQEAKRRIPRNFSIALGSLEVSPFEISRAYAIIANGGREVIPFSIRYIKDQDGKIIENREKEVKAKITEKRKKGTLQIIKPATAQIMVSMLSSVVTSGTGRSARSGRRTAGKTGTTNNYRDAWFVGFTPYITTAVWVGFDKMGMSLGAGQSGGSVAAPLWGRYMKEAVKGYPDVPFVSYAKLSEIEICHRSGLLPGEHCRKKVGEKFIPGSEPKKVCELCLETDIELNMAKRGPKEKIAKRQNRSILKSLRKNDPSEDDLVDDMSDDLLQ